MSSDCARIVWSGVCMKLDENYYNSLSPIEKNQYGNFLRAHLFRLENLVFQYQQGLLTREYHDAAIVGGIRYLLPAWELFYVPQRARLSAYADRAESEAA